MRLLVAPLDPPDEVRVYVRVGVCHVEVKPHPGGGGIVVRAHRHLLDDDVGAADAVRGDLGLLPEVPTKAVDGALYGGGEVAIHELSSGATQVNSMWVCTLTMSSSPITS